MDDPPAAAQAEVVDERPVGVDRLGSDAGRPEPELIVAQLRDVAPELVRERPLREVAPLLGEARPPEPPGEAPEAGVAGDRDDLAEIDVVAPVAVAGEREDRVRAGPDRAVVAAREVDPEEREARVRDRVDEPADERPRVRREPVVVAPERDDPLRAVVAGQRRHAVRPEAGAGDRPVGQDVAAGRRGEDAVGALLEAGHGPPGLDRPARGPDVVGVGVGDRPVVDDAGPRRPQPADPERVRLELPDPLRTDRLEALDAVLAGLRLERLEARQLVLRQGHDELADPLDLDPPLGAVRLERDLALAAEAGLERTRRVVEAGVDDAAVVAGLVGRELRLALDDQDPQPGPAHEHLAGGREAEDPAADDEEVGALDGRGGRGRYRDGGLHRASLSRLPAEPAGGRIHGAMPHRVARIATRMQGRFGWAP